MGLVFSILTAQEKHEWREYQSAGYTYKTVTNDLTGTRIYTLANGLTVYLSVYKSAPRIQTNIVVRAGSKQDPSDATGLAHYLEHLLFKGTDKFGTTNYDQEKGELEKIENLFEAYRSTQDTGDRRRIYHEIDSISGITASYAVANEYDQLVSKIGAKGTNAGTWYDFTVYVNDIPTSELERWLMVEAERFRNPVFRIFHTELEAVYEEKNRTLDNDRRKTHYAMMEELFKRHTYGTQTTIGTVDHLKNPSLKRIREYFDTYYVPNNMAMCMAGDFDPDSAIFLIDKYFCEFKKKNVPMFTFAAETEIHSVIERTVTGPDAESVTLGYRFPGANHPDTKVLSLIDLILSNGTTGLIDLHLEQKQKVLSAGSDISVYTDYSVHTLSGRPRDGQSLENVRDLLLEQLDLIKRGEFEDWLVPAIVRNIKIGRIRQLESNQGRVSAMFESFINDTPWIDEVSSIDQTARITKKEVMDVASRYYLNNHVTIYKRSGIDTTVKKVDKPPITPVALNRQSQSEFQKKLSLMPSGKLEPVFVDFSQSILQSKLANGVPMYYLRNDENALFTIYYVLDMGRAHDKKLEYAVDLLEYLGTDKYTAEQIRKEFYKLGCNFGVSAGEEETYVYLSGLEEDFDSGLSLFEHLLQNAKPDQEALDLLIEGVLKSRNDGKLNKGNILAGLSRYATFGAVNPFSNVLSQAELIGLKANELATKLHDLFSYPHRVLYYGARGEKHLKNSIEKCHIVPKTFKSIPPKTEYVRLDTKDSRVYFVPYDMVQAEIVWLSKSEPYHVEWAPLVSLFNEYFGGGMSSIVFQTIRESKALAYGVSARYSPPSKKEDPYYITAYVGTQADKMVEAIDGVNELFTTLSRSDLQFQSAKQSIKSRIESERMTKTAILFGYENARKLGIEFDLRKSIYHGLDDLSFEDIQKFQETYIRNRPAVYCVIGSKDRVRVDDLKKYGEVIELSLADVFGY